MLWNTEWSHVVDNSRTRIVADSITAQWPTCEKVRHSFVGVSADAQTNSVLEMKAGEKVFSLVSQPNENRDTG